jgi:hypothetical protein
MPDLTNILKNKNETLNKIYADDRIPMDKKINMVSNLSQSIIDQNH